MDHAGTVARSAYPVPNVAEDFLALVAPDDHVVKRPSNSTRGIAAQLVNTQACLNAFPRMEELGRSDRYEQELFKITHSKKIPLDWATPDQCCRAAIRAVGGCRQVIPLDRGGKQP